MDGNGRWATKKGLSRIDGHRAGFNRARDTIITCSKIGIKYVTLFAFSTENWKRPSIEIKGLMQLLEDGLNEISTDFKHHNIALHHLGRLDKLSPMLLNRINNLEKQTDKNKGTVASFAFDYGGRSEILDAVKCILEEKPEINQITESSFYDYCYSPDLPDVDLLIRTSGEQRISNFLLWQIAFAELHFTDTLWPDFDRTALLKALNEYASRHNKGIDTTDAPC